MPPSRHGLRGGVGDCMNTELINLTRVRRLTVVCIEKGVTAGGFRVTRLNDGNI